MFKNVSGQKIALFAFDITTGGGKTGDAANLTPYVSKDFGASTVLADTSATEIDSTKAPGWYWFDVAQAESNADDVLFSGKSTTANIQVVGRPFVTVPASWAMSLATDSVSAAALATDAVTEIVTAIFARAFSSAYSSLTFDQMIKVIAAALGGKLSGAAGTTITIRNLGDTADVVVATVDASGNRSAVTITP